MIVAAFTLALAATPGIISRCPEVDVALITRLDSATDVAGGAFEFKTVQRVPASDDVPNIPAGTRGFGILAFADHAHGAGQPGRIVVEPRFIALADGTRVQVIADPQYAESFVQGESRNLNGALQFVPGLGLAVGSYNALHRGKEVVIDRGTQFRVIIGDALALGECFVPPGDAPNVR